VLAEYTKKSNLLFEISVACCLTLMLTFNRTLQVVDLKSLFKLFQTDVLTSTVIFLLSIYFFSNSKLTRLEVRENLIVSISALLLSILHIVGSDVTYTHSTLRGTVNKFSILAFLLLVLISFFAINTLLRLLLNWFKHLTLYSINTEKKCFRKKLYLLMLLQFTTFTKTMSCSVYLNRCLYCFKYSIDK